jgi:hypothetical protein
MYRTLLTAALGWACGAAVLAQVGGAAPQALAALPPGQTMPASAASQAASAPPAAVPVVASAATDWTFTPRRGWTGRRAVR